MQGYDTILYIGAEQVKGEIVYGEDSFSPSDDTAALPFKHTFVGEFSWTSPQFTVNRPLLPAFTFDVDGTMTLQVERWVRRRPSRGRLTGMRLRPGILGWIAEPTWEGSRHDGRRAHRKALKKRGRL